MAIDLHLLSQESAPDFSQVFARELVAASEVDDGRALIATDFLADAFGCVRFLVTDRTLSPMSAGALVQRLLEVETYRTLALLGLPEAQKTQPPALRRWKPNCLR